MAFIENSTNQLSFDDSFLALTDREKRFLEKSWAKPFAEILFPAINEKPFAVLYSPKDESRPNTPVNIIIGSLILKEFMGLDDEEVIESLMFDVRFQYALHTTSFKEQPLSDRTLSRFRARCLAHEAKSGEDLIKDCIKSLATEISTVMGIDCNLKRMDSLMVAANIKKLSRLELLYVCTANAVKGLEKSKEEIPEGMEHYTKSDDQNKVIYHTKSKDINEKYSTILNDASIILDKSSTCFRSSKEYKLLERAINEQATLDENGELKLKDAKDKTMDSEILQNPSDPEATYRFKSGKQHRGYVANVVEDVGENSSIITDYDLQANTYSDSKFLKDTVENIGYQEDGITLIADGSYSGEENKSLAEENKINLVNTNFLGSKPADILADFEFSEDGKKVIKCAGGQEPKTCVYYSKSENVRITLDKDFCDKCPYKDQCKPYFHKKKTSKTISYKTVMRAKQLRYMKSSEFKELAKIRNGVESIPSTLRRKYDIDKMPVRGKDKTKLFFGFKIASINLKKLLDFLVLEDKCVQKQKLCTVYAQ